jgi:hypothetical protein
VSYPPSHRGFRVGLLTLIGLVGGVCSAPEESSEPTYLAPGLHEIQYRTEWAWGDATPTEEGGWTVVNDLGYSIQVTSGFITNYALQLVPCDDDERMATRFGWRDLVGIPTARAGHSEIAPDPSLLSMMHVESLTNPQDITTEPIVVTDHRYCRVHYVLGPADADAVGLASAQEMAGITLLLEGSVQGPHDDHSSPFRIETDLGIGTFVDWSPSDTTVVDIANQGALVVVRRTLGTLWDHVDFDKQEENEIAWFVLQNIMDSTRADVHIEHHGD